MNNKLKIFASFSLVLLSGCATGPQASFGEAMRDNFLFTSADTVPASERKCITLTKPFTLDNGAVTYSIPAGRYVGKKKNDTGYFYYAPTEIKSSNWFLGVNQQGIYLDDNQFNKGNLFFYPPRSYDDRPVRSDVLPNSIFPYIQKNGRCG